ncbi:hypothetical protein M9Y10_006861 [Tritrichomonas musculus]|uniref:beta-N-acetylhexosaminidase n=1 Tax=Tritrichomonas musculus TaxID=1915356 RepID=A0ABR2JFA9_9EUKA
MNERNFLNKHLLKINYWKFDFNNHHIILGSMCPVIVPKPNEIKINQGNFTLTDNFTIYLDPKLDLTNVKDFITEHFLPPTGFHFQVETSNQGNAKLCFIHKENIPREGYELELTSDKLTVHASSVSGHFYGLITFMQLLPPEIFSNEKSNSITWQAPCVSIKDSPQYEWRGMHLDCSRHFFNVDECKKYIYWMSLHKLNTFHWHITDDQGWRFESKKYPKLTEIGSSRIEQDGSKYGPYYFTQEQMKDVVAYAKKLCITVVPEIEMPGHSCAALAAYPELSCGIDLPIAVENQWGIFKPNYCLGNEKTIQFLKDILAETMEIFDSEYIHIGGDEVLPDYWLKCPKCQAVWKRENIKNPMDYQCWFNRQIAAFINEHGRKMIGWDEIMEEKLPKNNAIMAWNSAQTGAEAVALGYHVVLTPNECFYFDHCQFAKNDNYTYIGGMATLENVYNFDPVSRVSDRNLIIGVQANCWSERIFGFEDCQWKVFPRLCALSEVGWTKPDQKNFTSFDEGLNKVHFKRLQLMHINYAHESKI